MVTIAYTDDHAISLNAPTVSVIDIYHNVRNFNYIERVYILHFRTENHI